MRFVVNILYSNFEFVSDFDIRYSDLRLCFHQDLSERAMCYEKQ